MRTGVASLVLVLLSSSVVHAEEGAASLSDWLSLVLGRIGARIPSVAVGAQFGGYRAAMDFWNEELEAEGSDKSFGTGAVKGLGAQAGFGKHVFIRLDARHWTQTVTAEAARIQAETGFVSGRDEIVLTTVPISVAGVVYPRGLRRWAFCPYVGVGGGPCVVRLKRTRTATDGRSMTEQDTGSSLLGYVLAGVSRRLTYKLTLSAEGRYVLGGYVQQKLVEGVVQDRDVSLSGPEFEVRAYYTVR